jgi:hypothetical protein
MIDLQNPFETFQRTAFRVEALPHYLVTEEREALHQFITEGTFTQTNEDWWILVQSATSADKKIQRLRLVSEKLTDYERFEIQAYSGPSAGEDIRTALRQDHPELSDFWFFDEKYIGELHYAEDGTFISLNTREATPEELQTYRIAEYLFQGAKPLRQVPFVPNTDDDTHCLQAAYMSAAKYLDPTFAIPMSEWSNITGYEEGKGSWANAGPLWFMKQGYQVHQYELFDAEEFIKRPTEYMIEQHGPEAGKWGIENTNVPAEIIRMRQLLDAGIVERREPTMEDIKSFLDLGYLVRVTVNSNILNGKEGYLGHALLIFDYNESYIQFHDPGLPAIPNRQETFTLFEAAWSAQIKKMDAIGI